MKEPNLFRQSALIVAVIVTASFAIAKWDPLYPCLGISDTAFGFAKSLAASWLVLAVFRNAKHGNKARYALGLLPLLCTLGIFFDRVMCFPLLPHHYFQWSRWLTVAYIIPLVGIRPVCGRTIAQNIVALSAVGLVWLVLGFLTGWQAHVGGYGLDYSRFMAFVIHTVEAALIWVLVSLTAREELTRFFGKTWVRWVCASFCIIGTVYILLPEGWFHPLHGDCQIEWFRTLPFLPFVWYVLFTAWHCLKKVFTR